MGPSDRCFVIVNFFLIILYRNTKQIQRAHNYPSFSYIKKCETYIPISVRLFEYLCFQTSHSFFFTKKLAPSIACHICSFTCVFCRRFYFGRRDRVRSAVKYTLHCLRTLRENSVLSAVTKRDLLRSILSAWKVETCMFARFFVRISWYLLAPVFYVEKNFRLFWPLIGPE